MLDLRATAMEKPVLVIGWRTRNEEKAKALRRLIAQSTRIRPTSWELGQLHEAFLFPDRPDRIAFLREVARRSSRKAAQEPRRQLEKLLRLMRRIALREDPDPGRKAREYQRAFRRRHRKQIRERHRLYMREWRKIPWARANQLRSTAEWCKRNRDRINAGRRKLAAKRRRERAARVRSLLAGLSLR